MILRRYMTRQVATTTALVVTFLVVLLLGGRMIRYFGIAAEGRLDVGLLFTIIGYNIPYFLELILPLSFFIGLMLVFGRLYVDSEMAVLNASGISRGRLARLMTPLILSLFVMEAGLSVFGKPWGVKQSDTIWQQQSLNSAFDLIRPQSFISSDDYHLYVGGMNEDRSELRDVILVQTVEGRNTDSVSNKNNDSVSGSDTQSEANSAKIEDENTVTGNVDNRSEAAISETAIEDIAPSSNNNDLLSTITSPVVSNKVIPNSDGANLDGANLDNASSDDAQQTTQNQVASMTRDVIVLAKSARQVQGGEESDKTQLDLYQGRRYEIDANSKAYNQVSFERYRISINRPPMDTVNEDNIETQTLPVLWRAATGQTLVHKRTDDKPTVEYRYQQEVLPAQAELGYRFALPWLMIIAPMLAVPLAQVRPRQGRWLRLLPAILIFTSCALVIISLKKPVAKGTLTVWIYPIAILSFIALALYLNWASRIHHRVRFGLTAKNERLS